jgi:hypothetical protein
MGSVIKDDQFLVHILNNLSSEYELQVLFMEKKIGASTDPLTVETLREELNLKFERLHIHDDDKSDSFKEERALPMVQFKGRCNSCGKYGHKGADCKDRRTPVETTEETTAIMLTNPEASKATATIAKNTAIKQLIALRRRTRREENKQAMQPTQKQTKLFSLSSTTKI